LTVLLLKVTIVLSASMLALALMRRSSAALRHVVCAAGLAGALLTPLTVSFSPHVVPVPLPLVFAATATAAAASGFAWTRWLVGLWAGGAALLALRLLIGHIRMAMVIQKSEPAGAVYADGDVSVPVAAGLWKPVILLPRNAEQWPEDQRLAALRHEAAHIRRGDLWINLMAHITCAVYWFHPLVWMAAGRLKEEQESACDDAVLSAGFEPALYAEALAAAAKQLTSTSFAGCYMLTHTTLKTRLARLFDASLPRTYSISTLRRTGAICAVAIAAIGLVYAQQEKAGDRAKQSGEHVYKASDGVKPPRVLHKVDPKYTDEARDAKIEGTVLLKVVIGTDGLAHDINVVTSPDAGLGVKAAEAVQEWKFEPGTLNGEPVAVQAQIEVNFRLM